MGYGSAPIANIEISYNGVNLSGLELDEFIKLVIKEDKVTRRIYEDLQEDLNELVVDGMELSSYSSPGEFLKFTGELSVRYPKHTFSISIGDFGFYGVHYKLLNGDITEFEKEFADDDNGKPFTAAKLKNIDCWSDGVRYIKQEITTGILLA